MSSSASNAVPGNTPVRPIPLAPPITAQVEANHRIANSLQLISALLSAQGRELGEGAAREALETSVFRISAVAGIHRQLYLSDDGGVALASYLCDLIAGLRQSFCGDREDRRIHLDVAPVVVASDFATLIGMIVTELVLNACKHAYAIGEPGVIDVTILCGGPDRFGLEIRDYGTGRLRSAPPTSGFGVRIVDLLTRRLGAEGGYIDAPVGTCFAIRGPLPTW